VLQKLELALGSQFLLKSLLQLDILKDIIVIAFEHVLVLQG
jgi:hypothetical protein